MIERTRAPQAHLRPPAAWLALALASALAGCAGAPAPLGSVYQRLGGEAGVSSVVDDWLANAQADPRISETFAKADVPKLKAQLASQLCEIGGGPCSYEGPSMRAAHQGLKLGNAEFDAFIGDLAKALDRHEIGPTTQRELLFPLKAMRADVLGLESGS